MILMIVEMLVVCGGGGGVWVSYLWSAGGGPNFVKWKKASLVEWIFWKIEKDRIDSYVSNILYVSRTEISFRFRVHFDSTTKRYLSSKFHKMDDGANRLRTSLECTVGVKGYAAGAIDFNTVARTGTTIVQVWKGNE